MKHDAPDGDRARLWRGILNSVDKGAGVERRSRNLKRAQNVYEAFLQSERKWIEGQIAVAENSVTFAPAGGGISTSFAAERLGMPHRRRFLLRRDGGLRLVRVTELDLTSGAAAAVIAVSARDVSAITAAMHA